MKLLKFFAVVMLYIIIIGCAPKEEIFQPNVGLELSKTKVTVSDNRISEEFITVTITRFDEKNVPVNFIIKFTSNLQNVYPVDSNGNRITELFTRELLGKNSKDTLQFKVFGKNGEAQDSTYNLDMGLYWNNVTINGQDKRISVYVKDE